MRRIILLTILLFTVSLGRGQVTVDQSLTIEQYVNDILLGSGVQASNISFTGDMVQLGLLEGAGDTAFPMNAGLVLSTEDAITIADDLGSVPFVGTTGDVDLLNIANSVPALIGQSFTVGSINDLCVLEFDFIATGDTVRFNYSFGSDEYLEWVNTTYNDIFAFFLSGPGISGPYNSPPSFPGGAINIAQLPGTDPSLPITISSVNDMMNSSYYIDNFNNDGVNIDGFTTKLVAESVVECGGSYHIKLAIGDGSDAALGSFVILEQGSFESNAVVEVALSTDVGVFYDEAVVYEDCGIATMTFTRPIETNIEVEEMVVISYSGTAINGVDFTLMPDTVTFAPFENEVYYEIDAFLDEEDEGPETVVMEILNLAACNGGGLTTYFEFTINDYPDPLVVTGFDTAICSGDTIPLAPEITGGYGNFDFTWSPIVAHTYEVNVSPSETTTYFLSVSDTCGIPDQTTQFSVEVQVFPPLDVVIDQGDLLLNCNDFVSLTATASDGDGFYTDWYWYDQNDNNLFGWQNTLFYSVWSQATEINVDVTDGCGFTATGTVSVALNVPELIVDVPTEMLVLCNNSFTVNSDVTGGSAPYFYTWYVDGMLNGWDNFITYSTSDPVTITLDVSDNCGQLVSTDIVVTIDSPAIEIVMDNAFTGSCNTVFELQPTINGGSPNFQFDWTSNGNDLSSGPNGALSFQSDIDAILDLTVSDACAQTIQDQVQITIENPPVVVDLGNDINASCVDNTVIEVAILDGAGGYQYTWYVNGVEVGNDPTLVWQTYQTDLVSVSVDDACGGSSTDTLNLIIPDVPLSMVTTVDTVICFGNSLTLLAVADGGEGGFVYYWNTVNQYGEDITISPNLSQYFQVTATDICGKEISNEILVGVQNIFSDFFVTYISETGVQFNINPDQMCAGCTYFWDFGDGNTSYELNPYHEYDGLAGYDASLTISSPSGCSDVTYILVHAPVVLYIPNAFSPNNDGLNDVFAVVGDQITSYEIKIFNRWGELVFASNDVNEVWMGNDQSGDHYVSNGIYQYVVKVKGFNSDAFEKVGSIQLMR